jgi:hypothetical protein
MCGVEQGESRCDEPNFVSWELVSFRTGGLSPAALNCRFQDEYTLSRARREP